MRWLRVMSCPPLDCHEGGELPPLPVALGGVPVAGRRTCAGCSGRVRYLQVATDLAGLHAAQMRPPVLPQPRPPTAVLLWRVLTRWMAAFRLPPVGCPGGGWCRPGSALLPTVARGLPQRGRVLARLVFPASTALPPPPLRGGSLVYRFAIVVRLLARLYGGFLSPQG